MKRRVVAEPLDTLFFARNWDLDMRVARFFPNEGQAVYIEDGNLRIMPAASWITFNAILKGGE